MAFDFKQFVSDMDKKFPKKRHPRVLLTEADFEVIRANKDEEIMSKLIAHTVKYADGLLDAELPKHIIPDGIRLLGMSRRVLDHLTSLGLCYQITGDEKYAVRAYKEMEAVAAFPDWNPRHFLDPSEMAAAMSLGYDWFFDWLNDGQKAVIRNALFNMGLMQAMDDYEDKPRSRTYRWYQHMPGDNWKMVCNGGMAMAATAILDELDDEGKAICEKVLTLGFASTHRAVRDFYSEVDGDYVESLGYWEYASNYLAFHHSTLMSAAGDDYGLTDWEGLKKTPYFVLHMCGNSSHSFNFGDAGVTVMRPTVMLWYSRMLNAPSIASIRINAMRNGSVSINDLLYYRPNMSAELDTLPKNFGGVGRDNASFRSGWGKDDMFAAIHFGRNSVCHAHLDTGTFILEANGERFFADLGADNYNLRPYRNCYRFRAEGHNTLVFNPDDKMDQFMDNNSTISVYENTGNEGFALCDMSDAYPGKGAVRSMRLYRAERKTVIRDEIKCSADDVVYWFAHTMAGIELSEDGKSAILTANGKHLRAEVFGCYSFYVADPLPFPTSPISEPAIDQDGSLHAPSTNPGFRKLAIKATGAEAHTIEVAFTAE